MQLKLQDNLEWHALSLNEFGKEALIFRGLRKIPPESRCFPGFGEGTVAATALRKRGLKHISLNHVARLTIGRIEDGNGNYGFTI